MSRRLFLSTSPFIRISAKTNIKDAENCNDMERKFHAADSGKTRSIKSGSCLDASTIPAAQVIAR
jgi:hypothetical protein